MQSLQLIAAFQVLVKITVNILYTFQHCAYSMTSEVKLVGGSGPHEGNIFVGGLPVCDDYHDSDNARVVCRFVGGIMTY